MSRRVFVPLQSAPFGRFLRGSKSVEVRDAKSPVAQSVLLAKPGTPVLLRRGYSTADELHGRLGQVWRADRLDLLPTEVLELADLRDLSTSAFFDAQRPVVAFHVVLVDEEV